MQQRLRELGVGPTVTRAVSGPTTKGAKISIGKAIIKLPDDAYIDYFISAVDCVVGRPCAQAPLLGIIRVKSRIGFSSVDGEVTTEMIALGEIGAFDFLKDYLKRRTPSPTTAPPITIAPPLATGPATKGASIKIGGKSTKLPDYTYLDAFIISIYCSRDPCPSAPAYRVVINSNSWIEFSAVDGEIIEGRQMSEADMPAYDGLKTSLNLKTRRR